VTWSSSPIQAPSSNRNIVSVGIVSVVIDGCPFNHHHSAVAIQVLLFLWCHSNHSTVKCAFHVECHHSNVEKRNGVMRRVRLRVREIAEAQGVSMTKLHIRSEVGYNVIRRIFRDPYAEIMTTTLSRLAEALNVPTSSLLEDVSEEQYQAEQKQQRTTDDS
jgi:hypothetical protein